MDAIIPPVPTDPWAIDGKFSPPEEHAQLLVIGAGVAGLAAAIEAARLGLRVVLIDENPVPLSLMGIDVPHFYGQRMNAAVQEEARMVERLVAANPAIEAAFDAGVDVRMGITAWGAFANGPALQALSGRVVGLSDGKRAWLCGFDALILATGVRDLVLGFEGIDLPGVLGACGLHALLHRYDAFEGKCLVILGSGDLAATTAQAALDRGLDVAALIETLPTPQAARPALDSLAARGVRILTGATGVRAEAGGAGVAAAVVVHDGAGESERLACDTICLAIGAVPVIELASVLGCKLEFRGDLGGHVPLTSAHGATSLPGIFCVGDCAGIVVDDDVEARASATARAAAAWLGGSTQPLPLNTTETPRQDTTVYRLAWMRALASGDSGTPVCLCEEVTRAEFLGVQPPRYLGCESSKMATRDSKSLVADGPLNPDQIKRLTRAGMGPCQGRRCREQIALLLALESGASPATIPLASYRVPVRPLPLGLLAEAAESPEMRAGWDVWFGIRTQWVPYGIIGTPAEDAFLAAGAGGNMHA